MFLELHILQSFGPTNLNRDEDGNPKDCEFGGVRRARISSQCLKRAIRRSPEFEELTEVDNAKRSLSWAKELRKYLIGNGLEDTSAQKLSDQFAYFYADYSKKKKKTFADKRKEKENKGLEIGDSYPTDVLVYLSPKEYLQIAEKLISGEDPKIVADVVAKENKNRSSAPDIALFGRFLANRSETNVDAAVQVAHAISTHRVDTEYDFFTAVDDLKPNDDPGAGMMGSIGYNSACYYRYARLDCQKLLETLGDHDLAARTANAFLQASIDANPSGMGNSHDNQTPPALALAVVRQSGGGWSLANAFETPMRKEREGGVMARSVERLADAYQCLQENLDDGSAQAFVLVLQPGLDLKALAPHQITGRKKWAEAVVSALCNG